MTIELVETLYTLGRPGTYESKDWPDSLTQKFDQSAIPALIEIIRNIEEIDAGPVDHPANWAPLYAWRILGLLRSVEAIPPLIDAFDYLSDDEWALTELPLVMGMIGPPAIEPLATHLNEREQPEDSRIFAIAGLAEVVSFHPECRATIIDKFREYMQQPDIHAFELNGLLMGSIQDIEAVELLDEIRQMFARNCVDLFCAGDLEDVEISLGVRESRSTPPPQLSIINNIQDNFGHSATDEFEFGFSMPYQRAHPKVGRNDPCVCGSGKKYKKCCLNKE